MLFEACTALNNLSLYDTNLIGIKIASFKPNAKVLLDSVKTMQIEQKSQTFFSVIVLTLELIKRFRKLLNSYEFSISFGKVVHEKDLARVPSINWMCTVLKFR